MFDRWTERARKVHALARLEAYNFYHDFIDIEHLLLALLKEGTGVASVVFKKLGLDFNLAIERIKATIERGNVSLTAGQALPFTPRAKKVLEIVRQESGQQYIGTEHLLLAIFRESEIAQEVHPAVKVLIDLGISSEKIIAGISEICGTEICGGELGLTRQKESPLEKPEEKIPKHRIICQALSCIVEKYLVDYDLTFASGIIALLSVLEKMSLLKENRIEIAACLDKILGSLPDIKETKPLRNYLKLTVFSFR